jgi:hypothetical protein
MQSAEDRIGTDCSGCAAVNNLIEILVGAFVRTFKEAAL